jgi:hypothetical protein
MPCPAWRLWKTVNTVSPNGHEKIDDLTLSDWLAVAFLSQACRLSGCRAATCRRAVYGTNRTSVRQGGLPCWPHGHPPAAFALPSAISELPEPAVFAMMLVGLILLG